MHDKLIGPNRRVQVDAASGAGNITAITGIAGKRIALIHYCLSVDAAINITFLSNSTEIGGPLFFPANAGESDHDEDGMMLTAAGESLVLARSGAAAVGGYLRYKLLG